MNRTMMRRLSYILCLVLVAVGSYGTHVVSKEGKGNGSLLKDISGCELDLNNDGELDIALLLKTLRGHELLALLKTEQGYEAYQLSTRASFMHLSCHSGEFIKETPAGKGKVRERIHKTPGTYVQLAQPESASVAYYWNGSRFQEVWTSD